MGVQDVKIAFSVPAWSCKMSISVLLIKRSPKYRGQKLHLAKKRQGGTCARVCVRGCMCACVCARVHVCVSAQGDADCSPSSPGVETMQLVPPEQSYDHSCAE